MRWIGLACLACGCNAVLGLDPTHARDASDGRELACETGTPTGVDDDGDGVDDGCDPCLLGPQQLDGITLDEDGDGRFDACDACPAISDATSGDADGDGVGDACDLAPSSPQMRRRFDGFARLAAPWTGSGWTASGGMLTAAAAATLELPGLQLTPTTDGTWFVDAGIRLPASAVEGARVGIHLETSSQKVFECVVRYTAGAWELDAAVPTGVLASMPIADPAALQHVEASFQLVSFKASLRCGVRGQMPLIARDVAVLDPLHPSLVGDAGTSISYVDLVN